MFVYICHVVDGQPVHSVHFASSRPKLAGIGSSSARPIRVCSVQNGCIDNGLGGLTFSDCFEFSLLVCFKKKICSIVVIALLHWRFGTFYFGASTELSNDLVCDDCSILLVCSSQKGFISLIPTALFII